jgi:hypothetical protein
MISHGLIHEEITTFLDKGGLMASPEKPRLTI